METKKDLNENNTAFLRERSTVAVVLSVLMLIVSIAIIYLAHIRAPFMTDDLWYGTNIATDGPLKGVKDIWESQVWHYLNWGGRSITHTLLQFVLLGGSTVADILNVVMTYLLSTVIVIFALNLSGVKLDAGSKIFWLAAISGMLHGLNANWLMSMYWQSGSANYLYITSFILIFIWCYVRELDDSPAPALKGITVWIVPLAVITGWSNENMGPTAWLISVFTIIYLRKKKMPVKIWMILGSLFSLLGSAACILAPGNFVRSAEVDTDKGFLWKLFLRFYSESRAGIDFLYPVIIFTLLLAIIFYPVLKNKWDIKTIVILAAAVVSWGAMVLSPHYPDRATFGTMVLFMVVSVSYIFRMIGDHRELKPWLYGASVLVWLRGIFWLCEYIAASAGIIS